MSKVSILGSDISVYDLDETVEKLRELAESGGRHYVCVSNVHTVVMGTEDRAFAEVTNAASLATADGVPLIWASKVLGGPAIHGRASGPDIMARILRDPASRHLRHYFYGSTPEVLERLREQLAPILDEKQLAGFCSPPKRPAHTPLTALDADELADCRRIDEAAPHIVWVGLGAPKQEVWMYRARPHLNAPVLVGVGAAFDFLAGNKKRAPLWMQKSGLEWAYRFLQEPKRLASRYLKTNPVFVAEVAKQAIWGRIK
ncbi:MAG: WecB/TagA/CpsF family glycosyltransferase [Deltaproteobacteria bacterium]|nr:WecB/TagA/CpsF family glycosyltransferase [Deltaproteobacteria bacterium]